LSQCRIYLLGYIHETAFEKQRIEVNRSIE
jgi:hypothetical protein